MKLSRSLGRVPSIARRLRALAPFRDAAGANVTLILGSGRSGTTWLAEQLAANSQGRIIFEPLHPMAHRGRPWLINRKYLRADEDAPEWQALLDAIMNGSFRSVWADRYNHQLAYDHRIVKEIFANLMVGWLARIYPHVRIAFVIRNPVAVAVSQLRGGWPIELDRFRSQPTLVADYPIVNSEIVSAAATQFELNIAHWAIENRVALDQLHAARAAGARVAVFRYESLRDEPEMFRRFAEFCEVHLTRQAMDDVSRPSRVSRGEGPSAGGSHLRPSPAEVAYGEAIQSAFALNDLDAACEASTPALDGAL